MKTFIFVLLASSMALSSQAQNTASIKQYSPAEVSIDKGEYKDRELWDQKFLMSLSPDRFLFFFRQNAGLQNPGGVKAYGGWEQGDVKGHSFGHYLTAMSYLYAHSKDPEVKNRLDYSIKVLKECQDKIGIGFVSAFPESLVNYHDETGLGWAPYYTLHKILQGILDVYRFTGNKDALAIASRFGDYIYGRTQKITDMDKWHHNQDIMEVGGFVEAMINLYTLTNKPEHLKAAQFYHQMDKLEPSAEGKDILNAPKLNTQQLRNDFANLYHANATIPQFISAWKDYTVTGNEMMLKAAQNFWTNVIEHRTYCNGTTSGHEHWNYPQDQLSKELNYDCGETCCTYNLIKLSNDLFTINPDSKYADYVERALINDIMASIQPETSNFMYFHTQKQGGFKTFGPNTDCFWCCTGTGMENHQRYAESVYFFDGIDLFVNQFMSSTLNTKDIKLRQVTNFPLEEKSIIYVDEANVKFNICVRVPYWCKGFSVKVNCKSVKATKNQNGYAKIEREWKKGDKIEIFLPMTLYTQAMKDDPKMAAIFFGPIVLAGDLGKEGVEEKWVTNTDNFFNGAPKEIMPNFAIPSLTGDILKPAKWLKRVPGTLNFKTSATSDGKEITFRPMYQINDSRFADYWVFE